MNGRIIIGSVACLFSFVRVHLLPYPGDKLAGNVRKSCVQNDSVPLVDILSSHFLCFSFPADSSSYMLQGWQQWRTCVKVHECHNGPSLIFF